MAKLNRDKFKITKMNILELLKKYAEKGDVFYSLIHGECTLTALRDLTRHNICPTITMENLQGLQLSFYENGTFYDGIGECVIFPSKEQHDWKKWAEEKETKRKNFQVGDHVFYNKTSLGVVTSANSSTFIINFVKDNNSLMFDQANPVRLEKTDHFDYTYFKPKDYILIRDYKKEWALAQFSHISKSGSIIAFGGINCMMKEVIPYNSETRCLLGTTDDCPKFYQQ